MLPGADFHQKLHRKGTGISANVMIHVHCACLYAKKRDILTRSEKNNHVGFDFFHFDHIADNWRQLSL